MFGKHRRARVKNLHASLLLAGPGSWRRNAPGDMWRVTLVARLAIQHARFSIFFEHDIEHRNGPLGRSARSPTGRTSHAKASAEKSILRSSMRYRLAIALGLLAVAITPLGAQTK